MVLRFRDRGRGAGHSLLSHFGNTLAGGDLDGDGYGDLIVGSLSVGEVAVYHGGADGIAGPAVILSDPNSDRLLLLRHLIAVAGDLNGDGVVDLAIGANALTVNQMTLGAAYVYFGRTDGTLTAPTTSPNWAAPSATCRSGGRRAPTAARRPSREHRLADVPLPRRYSAPRRRPCWSPRPSTPRPPRPPGGESSTSDG